MADPAQVVTGWRQAVDGAWNQLMAAGAADPGHKDPGQATVDAAKAEIGLPYAWGAGNKNGPTYGEGDGPGGDATRYQDSTKIGFDCSGLTEYATYQGTGVDIGKGTGNQVDFLRKNGALLPSTDPSQLQPGDLVYFHDPGGSQAHTAVYEGNGTVIEAPHSGPIGDPNSEVKHTPLSQLTRSEGPITYAARPSLVKR